MKTAKHRRFAGTIQVVSLAAALFVAAVGPVLPSHAQTPDAPGETGDAPTRNDCNPIFNGSFEQKLTEIKIKQTFHAIQAQQLEDGFSLGDRVLFRIAHDAADPALSLLTPQGLKEFERLAGEQPDLTAVLKDLTEHHYTQSEVAELLAKPNVHPLERMLKARSTQEWDEMLRIYEGLADVEKEYSHVKLQAAFALNRRNKVGDRNRALKLAQEVLQQPGPMNTEILSEGYGILARIYKDRYGESNDLAHLELAVDSYLKGFTLDAFNYYPGIAALELLYTIPGPDAARKIKSLTPLVKKALQKSIERSPNDYWALATQLKLFVRERDWGGIDRLLPKMFTVGDAMMLQSDLDGLQRLVPAWTIENGYSAADVKELKQVVASFQSALAKEKEEIVIRPSFRLTVQKPFPETEGAITVKPLVLRDEMIKAEVQNEITPEVTRVIRQESVQKFLQISQAETMKNPGYLLGVTGPYKKAVGTLSRRAGHTPWWQAYEEVGIEAKVQNTERFLRAIAETEKPIVLLIPKQFHTKFDGTTTMEEYNWILRNRRYIKGQVEFVYGAYDLMGLDFYQQVSQLQADGYDERYMFEMVRSLQHYLTNLGSTIVW